MVNKHINHNNKMTQPLTPLPSINQLKWQCRRGMLELDYLFSDFLEKQYNALSEPDKRLFVELLTHSDTDLQQWLVNKSSPAEHHLISIVEKITHIKS